MMCFSLCVILFLMLSPDPLDVTKRKHTGAWESITEASLVPLLSNAFQLCCDLKHGLCGSKSQRHVNSILNSI